MKILDTTLVIIRKKHVDLC